jgi:hypothetical protein
VVFEASQIIVLVEKLPDFFNTWFTAISTLAGGIITQNRVKNRRRPDGFGPVGCAALPFVLYTVVQYVSRGARTFFQ